MQAVTNRSVGFRKRVIDFLDTLTPIADCGSGGEGTVISREFAAEIITQFDFMRSSQPYINPDEGFIENYEEVTRYGLEYGFKGYATKIEVEKFFHENDVEIRSAIKRMVRDDEAGKSIIGDISHYAGFNKYDIAEVVYFKPESDGEKSDVQFEILKVMIDYCVEKLCWQYKRYVEEIIRNQRY